MMFLHLIWSFSLSSLYRFQPVVATVDYAHKFESDFYEVGKWPLHTILKVPEVNENVFGLCFIQRIYDRKTCWKKRSEKHSGFCWVTRRNGVRDAAWRQERQRVRRRERDPLQASQNGVKMETKGEGKSGSPFPKCQSVSRVHEQRRETGWKQDRTTEPITSNRDAVQWEPFKGQREKSLHAASDTQNPRAPLTGNISVLWTFETLKSQLCGLLKKLWQSWNNQCYGDINRL